MSVTQIKISSLPVGAVAPGSIVIFNGTNGLTTYRGTAGALAALSGPVASVQGVTGAVSLNATSVGAALASHTHQTGDISNFNAAVVSIAATASPVLSVNGLTGAVSLNATSVGAAPASHTHATGEIDNFANAVAIIASTTGPVWSVNGLTGAVTISGGGGGDVESVQGLTGAVSLNATSVGAAAATHGTAHARTGVDKVPVVIVTVAALTQNESALAIPACDVAYISAATTDREIQGFTGGTTDWPQLLINHGASYALVVKHAHTSAATSDRVLIPWEGDYVIAPKGGALVRIYDTTESRWRIV